MSRRILRSCSVDVPAPEPAMAEEAATIAAQLRAQIPGSTDPERLERLACEAECQCGAPVTAKR